MVVLSFRLQEIFTISAFCDHSGRYVVFLRGKTLHRVCWALALCSYKYAKHQKQQESSQKYSQRNWKWSLLRTLVDSRFMQYDTILHTSVHWQWLVISGTHKRRAIPRPHGRAMACLLWEKLTMKFWRYIVWCLSLCFQLKPGPQTPWRPTLPWIIQRRSMGATASQLAWLRMAFT